MADSPVARQAAGKAAERARLTFRRLTGLDRSGPPPPQTLRGQPWNVWTIPNAIGFVRLALIPVFLGLALSSESGTDALPAVIFAVISWSDYFDGIAARVTGQYSRLGALLDPLTDRVLILSGAVVSWHFELLPRWALAVLAGRELLMLGLTQVSLRAGLELTINWLGRWAVWPLMMALTGAMIFETWLTGALLYLGLGMTLAASGLYLQDGYRRLKHVPSSSA